MSKPCKLRHTHKHSHTYIHTHTNVYIYIYIYIYITESFVMSKKKTPLLSWCCRTDFYALAYSLSLIVYVCVCSLCHANQPDVLWPHRWSHSFRSWLIWKVNSSSLILCKQYWDVTCPWPIYSAPKWTLRKSRFFAMFGRFVRNRSRYRNNFNGQQIGYGLSNDTKMNPKTPNSLLPLIWGRKLEEMRKIEFSTSNDKPTAILFRSKTYCGRLVPLDV